jgi:murein DD-endopeptidase MepM/ murein hydrolase activator NlpD
VNTDFPGDPVTSSLLRHGRWAAPLVALALVSLVALLLPAGASAQSAEERQLQQAKDRLSSISDEIRDAEDDAADAEVEFEAADERLREVEAVVNEVAAAVDRQQGAVREAERRLDEVEAEAAEVAEAFAERASRMYKQGASMSFEVLLNSDDATDAFARSSYLHQVTQADRANMESLDASQVAVAAERERLEAERERLAEMHAEQEELLAEVQVIRDSRAMAAAEAREQVRLLQGEQDDLEDEQGELESLIQQRQEAERQAAREAERAAAQQATTGAASSSGFAWPMCAPVTSEYGPRWGRMHRGIDQGASSGTPIGASKAGTVIFADWQGGYGRMVLIDHHDGVVTAYAHMSGFSVSQGASVSQGQTIGTVGSTGNSTGPHLHFETRVNGSAVNPRQYLPGSPC